MLRTSRYELPNLGRRRGRKDKKAVDYIGNTLRINSWFFLEDGSLKFTASGKKHGDRACREFRDSSGLPLFELHQKAIFTHSWFVTLPGSDHASIAKAAPKWSFIQGTHDFSLSFENQAATDGKGQEEERVELNIERHGGILALYDVVDRDRKVAVVRESIEHNETLPFMNSRWRRYKPILEVTVASGADMSMVRIFPPGLWEFG